MDLVKILSEQYIKEELPEMNVGDTVRVLVRVKEGNRERTQAFEGTIIAKKHGGINETITVRRIPQGQGSQSQAVLPARSRGQGGQGQGAPVRQKRKGIFRSEDAFCVYAPIHGDAKLLELETGKGDAIEKGSYHRAAPGFRRH